MNVYQILTGAIFMTLGCIGIIVRAIQVSKRDPWWAKVLTYFLAMFVIVFIGGLGISSSVEAYRDIGSPVPHIKQPAPPEHWWK